MIFFFFLFLLMISVTPIRKTQQVFSCQTYGKEENDFYKLTYGSGKIL